MKPLELFMAPEWGLAAASKLVREYYNLARESIEELESNTLSIIEILEFGVSTELGGVPPNIDSSELSENQKLLLSKLIFSLNINDIVITDIDKLVNLLINRIPIIQKIAGIKHSYDISSYARYSGDFVEAIITSTTNDNKKNNALIHLVLEILKVIFDREIEALEIKQIEAEAEIQVGKL